MNILVTGGLGLIGHNVVCNLQKLGHNIVITDTKTTYGIVSKYELDYLMKGRLAKINAYKDNLPTIYTHDISDYKKMRELFFSHQFDMVFHLASFPRQKVVNANPILGSKVMCEGLLNLLELSKEFNISKFLYVSSSMVYGDFNDYVTEDAICNPQGQYGILKLAGEWLVKDYSRKKHFTHTIIRPSAVYGPYDVEDRVVSKFMLSAMRNETLHVNGSNETLDFTYVDDAANGIVAAALSDNTHNKTYNITKSHSTSLLDAAKLAISIVNSGTISVRNKDADFPSRGALNIDAARKDFGFDPKVDVVQGFEVYYEWLSNSPFWSSKTAS